MGAKPRPVWRNARPPGFYGRRRRGCGVDCKASKATSRNRVILRRRHDGAVKGGRRPQADPAREAPTGAECKPVGRAGQAQPDRKVTSESDFGKVPLSRQFTRSLSGEYIKTAPKSRAGLSTKRREAGVSWP